MILLGADVEMPAREMADATGESVLAIRNSHLKTYNGELYKDLLYEVLPALDPVFILAAQTTRGLDFGPGLAVRFEAACITGVNALVDERRRALFFKGCIPWENRDACTSDRRDHASPCSTGCFQDL